MGTAATMKVNPPAEGDAVNVPLDLLAKHAPRLVELLGPKPKQWAQLSTKASARMDVAGEAVAADGAWTGPTTLVDLAFWAEMDLWTGKADHDRNLAFLTFIESQAVELASRIPERLLPTLRREMLDLFVNFSTVQSKYLDKVGELAAMLYLLRSTGGTLAELEMPLPDIGTSIDVVVEMPSGGRIPVEFLNIHIEDDRLHSPQNLTDFLDGRVKRKVEAKLKRGHEAGAGSPFPLLLILWFQRVETLQKFAKVLIGRAAETGLELPICTLQQFGNQDGYVEWRFSSVDQLVHGHDLLATTK